MDRNVCVPPLPARTNESRHLVAKCFVVLVVKITSLWWCFLFAFKATASRRGILEGPMGPLIPAASAVPHASSPMEHARHWSDPNLRLGLELHVTGLQECLQHTKVVLVHILD